jgi:hypothetical protein
VIIDEQRGVLSDLHARAPGMLVRWSPSPVDDLRGGVPTLVFSCSLIGPVTRSDPLKVLGQPITITADTVLEGFERGAPLPPGTPMIVGALVDSNGSHYASLAVRRAVPGNKFVLAGYVQQLAPAQPRLRIGNQWIDTTAVGFADCIGAAPLVGDQLGYEHTQPVPGVVAAVVSGRHQLRYRSCPVQQRLRGAVAKCAIDPAHRSIAASRSRVPRDARASRSAAPSAAAAGAARLFFAAGLAAINKTDRTPLRCAAVPIRPRRATCGSIAARRRR